MYRGPLIENEVLYYFSAAVLCLVAQSCLILCDSKTVVGQAPLSMGIL